MLPIFLALLLAIPLLAQTTTGGLTPKGAVNLTTASSVTVTTQSPGDNSTKPASTAYADAAAAAVAKHSFVCNIGSAIGSTVIATGDSGCYSDTGTLSGTITGVYVTGNAASLATCSITVDIWKTNAAYPTSSNKISASAPATLSTAKTNDAGSVGTWTKPVAAHDRWGASVASVTGCVYVQVRVEFQ